MFAFGMFDKAPSGSPSAVATNSTDQADATQLAEEGTVLLKNSGSVLPLTSSDKSIAVIGADASTSPQTDGGGSAGVNSSGTVTPLQGIQAAAPSGTTVTYNNGSSDSSAASAAAAASVAVVFANLGESEGSDLSSIDLGHHAGQPDHLGGRGQPEHDRGPQHRLRGHHAVALLGQGRARGLVPRARRTAPRSPTSCSAATTRPGT